MSDSTHDASLIDMLRSRLSADDADLSTIPAVAQEIIAASQSPECDLRDLERLVSRDPVIASRIIQLANSSFYRGLADTDSLPQAIMRLGFKEVQNVTVAIAMRHVYASDSDRYAGELRRLWKSSIAGALSCRELAEAARFGKPDEAFLAGLVRDIGSVFIIESIERMARDDARVASLPEPVFRELLHALHEDFGASLLERLQFHDTICRAVRCHHDPSRLDGDAQLAWLLAASDLIVAKLGLDGSPPDPGMSLGGRPPLQALGLGDIEIARVLVDLEDQGPEMLGLLS